MRVLHIAENANSRLFKIAKVEAQSGIDVTIIAGKTYHRDLAAEFDNVMLGLFSRRILQEQVDAADVVVAHLSVDPTNIMQQLTSVPREKLVLDLNDVLERPSEIGGRAKALMVPSPHMKEWSQSLKTNGAFLVQSKVPRSWWPDRADYVITNTVGCPTFTSSTYVYRDYREVGKVLDGRLFVHSAVHPADLEHAAGMNLVTVCGYKELLRRMSRYEWGWAGAANSQHAIHECLTNKFWESLAAGTPVLTWRSETMTKIAEGLGVGLEWNGRYPNQNEARKCRSRIEPNAKTLAMEAELPAILACYEEMTK